jgi:hypothetical protein
MRDTPLLGEILWGWVYRELPAESTSANRVATVVQATGRELRDRPSGAGGRFTCGIAIEMRATLS